MNYFSNDIPGTSVGARRACMHYACLDLHVNEDLNEYFALLFACMFFRVCVCLFLTLLH